MKAAVAGTGHDAPVFDTSPLTLNETTDLILDKRERERFS
jgi:hypothetical protein